MPTIRIPPDKITHIEESKIKNSNSVKNIILLHPSNLSIEQSTKNLKSIIKGTSLFEKKDSSSTFEESKNEEGAIFTSQDDVVIRNPHKAEEVTSPLVGNADRNLQEVEEVASSDKSSQEVMIDEIGTDDRNLQKRKKGASSKSQVSLPSIISKLLKEEKDLYSPLFKFEVSEEAAEFNWNLLSSEKFNIEKVLNPKETCTTSFGSEFKEIKELESLLHLHPRWEKLKELLSKGADFPLIDLPEKTRRLDLQKSYQRGNHKSAIREENFLAEATVKEIKKGWVLILPEDKYDSIPGLVLNPMGVATHLGVTADGTFKSKRRVTHDLSFPGFYSEESVNSRIEKHSLEPIMFGHTLLRIIHYIVNLRTRHPHAIIWIRKEDFKSAFRRTHLNGISAVRSAFRIKIHGLWYLLISLRMPFGGSPCPNHFCLISDIICDTINDLLNCTEWDPDVVHSNFVKKIPREISLDNSIPFAQARKMSVSLPAEDLGKADVFIDDIISVCVDIGNNLKRLKAAPCTIIHAVSRKDSTSPIIPRDDMICDDKNKAEGAPEERKICLGWLLDTRRLLVSLPSHKAKAWKSQIEDLLARKSVDEETLVSILGRLENIATIIPMMGHFLNNIRHLSLICEKKGHNVCLNKRVKEDLILGQKFIDKAYRGISMNLVVFRKPDVIYIGDASEHGLGAYASHGEAWRYLIPENLRGRAHINLLEFLIHVVSIWIDILKKKVSKEDCLLSMGDSTTAMGWLRRSNFRAKDESDQEWIVKQDVARKLAELILDSELVLYQQWFAGSSNVVADSLSRDCYYMNINTHEKFLKTVCLPQLPNNFQIKQIPKEISCFITSILERLPVKKQRLIPQKPSELALGNIGILSSLASASQTTSSLTDYQNSNKTSFSQLSPKQLENHPSHQEIINLWWKEQSTPPCHMWHRPLGQTTGMIPDWTQMVKLASSSKNNSEAIRTRIAQGRNKKPYPCQS